MVKMVREKEELESVLYHTGVLMRENPEFRLHRNREGLIVSVRERMRDLNLDVPSMESITRAQRKLWEIALQSLSIGDFVTAFNFLPESIVDFEEWCRIRKVGVEKYRAFFCQGVMTARHARRGL